MDVLRQLMSVLRFVYGPAGNKKKTYDLIRIYRLPQKLMKLSKFSLQNYVFLWSCPWFARGLSTGRMSINGRRNAINVGCAEAINLMVEQFQGIYIYIYGAASPTPPPPVDGSWSPPPPLWLWGCGGALLVSDAADFLWFLVPPPPCGCVDGSWWWWRCWKYVYKYLCVYEYIYMYMYMMKWICTYNHMYIYVYIYTYVIMFMNMYVYGYVSSPPLWCG